MTLESQQGEYRAYLLRFARLQLRNDAWAEDAGSETLLAALARPRSFGNRSQLKPWLVGILKHKVIDILRLLLIERAALRLHLAVCQACPVFERQLLTMRNALDRWRHYTDE